MWKTALGRLRLIGLLEGVSYLVLLGLSLIHILAALTTAPT